MSKHRKYKSNTATPNKLLDIIIPVYGRFDLFQKCLDALPAAIGDISYNLIILDNNSIEVDPKTNEFYSTLDLPNCTIIRNKKNVGFPAVCNQGARRKNSPILLFLNTDIIFQPDSIKHMVLALDDPSVGVVGAKLIFPDDVGKLNARIRPAGKVQHVGICTNVRGEFIHSLVGWSPDNPKVLRIREAYAVTGAAIMTRRNLYTKVGGFWEGYGVGTWEDVDFCLTIRELGYNVIVEQKAVGLHYTSATAEHYNKPYPLNNNRMLFMQRWGNKLKYTEMDVW